jgi:hypothetical protein
MLLGSILPGDSLWLLCPTTLGKKRWQLTNWQLISNSLWRLSSRQPAHDLRQISFEQQQLTVARYIILAATQAATAR